MASPHPARSVTPLQGRRAIAPVVHACWSDRFLHLWAEVPPGTATDHHPIPHAPSADGVDAAATAIPHPSTLTPVDLRVALDLPDPEKGSDDAELVLRLPTRSDAAQGGDERTAVRVLPSDILAHALGVPGVGEMEPGTAALASVRVATLRVPPSRAAAVLESLEDLGSGDTLADLDAAGSNGHGGADGAAPPSVLLGDSTRFLAAAARFARHLLAQQRFVPMLQQDATGSLRGLWQAWLGDEATARRVVALHAAMPPICRAAVDGFANDGAAMLEDFLLKLVDAGCRATLSRETMLDAIDGRDPVADPHVAWLTGLLGAAGEADAIDAGPAARAELIKGVRRWVGGLEERGSGSQWRLLLRLDEPLDLGGLADFANPGEGVRWRLTLNLQSALNPAIAVSAEDIWLLPPGAASVEGIRIEGPQDLLLAELGRASRLFKRLESVLDQAEPSELDLTTPEAYKFLREVRPVLIEQGFEVRAPAWWDSPTVRLGARLLVESEDVDLSSNFFGGAGGPGSSITQLGLSSLVNYRWQIAVGETNLTIDQFEKLAAQHSPLIRLNGRWVEIRPEDVKAAMRFIGENPGGEMEVMRALRLAYGTDPRETGIPILGMEATGWVASVFGDANKNETLPMLESPQGFIGTLRPYQIKGLSWLAFLDRLGLGSCLADDMGLGKTVQLLALLAHERWVFNAGRPAEPIPSTPDDAALGSASQAEVGSERRPTRPPPTLLVVPMSVVANWVHEARRFTPTLKVLVQHGVDRKIGDALLDAATDADIVITTYALAHRDRDHLKRVPWTRVVLDEAQNIKNPGAKQTRAVHALEAPRRIALTGTPLENRLTELWSIMDFLNPGYLGPAGEFRRKFAVPIERYHDRHRGSQLRGLVQPFILRRLKTDPAVITDLPEKLESKEYCYLTPEQATLYQTCVADMLTAAERAEGIQRRGVVLAGLIKLKQICNHPAHFLKEWPEDGNASGAPPISAPRSGKTQRMVEMLQEVVAAGDKALVFTQFRQMGHLIQTLLRRTLDREILFLHGGTPAAQRTQIVAEFQGETRTSRGGPGAGGPPVLVLSLKAGGVGLNLTAANHVFHFDRWWNPAVEAQATDRAYRIGQTRTVLVHKFVVSGTLEERIDQMIEEKTELADQIIGAGERWLTELSTGQLRDLLMLRADAVGEEEEVEA